MSTRPFFDTIRDIRRGQFLEDCADELQKVVAAVAETGQKATLTIQIEVSPAKVGAGAVRLTDRIKAKLPPDPAGETLLFVTPDNNLVTTDPRQQNLPLREAGATAAPINVVY